MYMPRARSTGCGKSSCCRTRTTTNHRRDTTHERFINLLRTNKVYVRINSTSSNNHAFARNDFSAGSHNNIYPRLNIRITRFTYLMNKSIFKTYISFNNTPMVNDEHIRNDSINAIDTHTLALPHTITNDFAATKFNFFSINREVFFNFDPQIRIG